MVALFDSEEVERAAVESVGSLPTHCGKELVRDEDDKLVSVPRNCVEEDRWFQKRHAQFLGSCGQGERVFRERAERYGDATRGTGMIGAAIALIGDVSRLRRLVLTADSFSDLDCAAIEDAFIDIHNYAAIGLLWLQRGNIAGEFLDREI